MLEKGHEWGLDRSKINLLLIFSHGYGYWSGTEDWN